MATHSIKTKFDTLQTSYRPFEGNDSDDDEDDSAPPNFTTGTLAFNNVGGSPSRQAGGGPGGPHQDGDTPYGHDPGVMIHMVAEAGKSKWSHIDDLDSFFTKVYEYHQKHGFTVMMLQELLELIQFIFMIVFTVFMVECINYTLLFNNDPTRPKDSGKLFISDVIELKSFAEFTFLTKCFVLISALFWVTRAIVVMYHVFQFWDIKCFYNTALRISDYDLESVSWWEVQQRLLAAQTEHMMCIHKEVLTELDIHHRILRFENYLVAMINKSLLPLRFNIPLLGDYVFLSTGLKFNLEVILFKSPWAPFNQWHLRDEYKRVAKRKELADTLQNRILILGCINLLLMPVILVWQILYSFFNYAEVIKREPGCLGVRKWGLFGRYYLRHFNELDHEISARLSRAYKPASYYMDIFVSPLATVLARFIAFLAGSVLAVLILLTVWDEDVLSVDHVLTVMTVLGAAVAGARVFIPDENLVFSPEKSLTQVLSHIHYFPCVWQGEAHTYKVMTELGLLFPYTAIYLVDELLSPVITPIILIFHLRYKSQEIIDFFRNFTVDVVGVGDVCSFAQMDVRRHGNPGWQTDDQTTSEPSVPLAKTNNYTQAEDGKTEMSLVHFTITNPGWKPSLDSEKYLTGLRHCAEKDVTELSTVPEQESFRKPESYRNALYESISALSNMGGSYRDVALRVLETGGSVPSPPPHTAPSPPPHHDIVAPSPPRAHTESSGSLSPPPPTIQCTTSQAGAQSTSKSKMERRQSEGGGELPSRGGVASQLLLRGATGVNRAPANLYTSRMQHHPALGGGVMPSSSTFTDSRLYSPTPSLMQSRLHQMQTPASLLNSGLPPPPSYHQELIAVGGAGNGGLMGEFAAADMSLSALYLHNIQHRNALRRPSIGTASRYNFHWDNGRPGLPDTNRTIPDETEPLIRNINA